MRKLILMGRSEAGKSTLIQAMRRETIRYVKTQYIDNSEEIIDTPGEYTEDRRLGSAIAIFSAESDVIGFVISAIEPYSLFSPAAACQATRPVVGIVTKCDHPEAVPERAAEWLRMAGCSRIFYTSAYKREGVDELLDFLNSDER